MGRNSAGLYLWAARHERSRSTLTLFADLAAAGYLLYPSRMVGLATDIVFRIVRFRADGRRDCVGLAGRSSIETPLPCLFSPSDGLSLCRAVLLVLGIFLWTLAHRTLGQGTVFPFLARFTLGVYVSHIFIDYTLASRAGSVAGSADNLASPLYIGGVWVICAADVGTVAHSMDTPRGDPGADPPDSRRSLSVPPEVSSTPQCDSAASRAIASK